MRSRGGTLGHHGSLVSVAGTSDTVCDAFVTQLINAGFQLAEKSPFEGDAAEWWRGIDSDSKTIIQLRVTIYRYIYIFFCAQFGTT